ALATPRTPVGTVYNGVDFETFRPSADRRAVRRKLGLPAGGIGICMVGRLMAGKGVRELMAAFATLGATHPSVWLALVGDGPLTAEVRAWRAATGFRDRVFLPGMASAPEVAAWLNAADLFVLPT